MLSGIYNFSDYLRACANCGCGTFLRSSSIDLYCQKCWINLFDQASVSVAADYPFKVSSLLVWTNFNPQVENLIYSLKGGKLPLAFQKLAERFAFELCVESKKLNPILVIPPSAREPENDHARAWGLALSEALGLKVASPFEFATEGKTNNLLTLGPQKRLRVNARFERQFQLKPDIALEDSKIVFVDDLITSGATAFAAYKALKSPVNFEVWTIARRPKLAGI